MADEFYDRARAGTARGLQARALLLAVVLGASSAPAVTGEEGAARLAPTFTVDASWPQTLPNRWIIGQVGGIAVDGNDHIWVLHRPRSLSSTAVGAQGVAGSNAAGTPVDGLGNPRPFAEPHADCCIAAPSVLRFDTGGKLLDAWGGPSDPGFLETRCRADEGCVWPAMEHGIHVDHRGNVYVAGNNGSARGGSPWAGTHGYDSQVLKFSAEGKFIYQIGHAGFAGPSNEDTDGGPGGTPQPFRPAAMSVDPATNRLYIADGYGNSRVLVVDADTGAYVGHFGAYGNNPVVVEPAGAPSWAAAYREGAARPDYFRSPVHCVAISDDRLLYVCDRANNRVQVFDLDAAGKPCSNPEARAGVCGFVREFAVAPETVGQTASDAALSADEQESCLYVADLWNGVFHVLGRDSGKALQRVGRTGRQAGEFTWLHGLAVDSAGNVYTAEVETGQRVQRFERSGREGCPSPAAG